MCCREGGEYIFKSFSTSHLSDRPDFGCTRLSHCLLPHREPHLGGLPAGAGRGGVALVVEGSRSEGGGVCHVGGSRGPCH